MKIKTYLDILNISNILEIISGNERHYKIVILDFETKKILSSKDEKYYKLLDKNILNLNEIKAKNIDYIIITPEL